MTPQILGGLTTAASKAAQAQQAANTASQQAINAQNTADGAVASVAALNVTNPVQIVNPQVWINNGTQIAWTQVSLAGFGVPQSATRVHINGYAYFSTPDNHDVELGFAPVLQPGIAPAAYYRACRYRSVASNYSGNAAFDLWVPIGPGAGIQYQILNGSYSILEVYVMEYE